ncbi:MAG: SRPBCC family protein [Gordonia sp. (in: high G+C Gram-positive bacteria)]|uniref:SRPBCC family protein n=1 Tax=Gordonia sp. (in: high G+C Gram-positive bacteria) TaxID=84139 RepID=UPI0039E676BB
MTDTAPTVSADIVISADPAKVYALITDLDVMSGIAAETTSMAWIRGRGAAPGAKFKGRNANGGKKWTTTCTVTAAEPGRAFEFEVKSAVLPIARWRYDIEAVDGGCRVTESTWDRRPGWFVPIGGKATGVVDRAGANADHIRMTLAGLKARAEAV